MNQSVAHEQSLFAPVAGQVVQRRGRMAYVHNDALSESENANA
jgi:hypothetical protein